MFVCLCVKTTAVLIRYESIRAYLDWMTFNPQEEVLPPDASAPRSLSGVPVKPCWAATVGTYSSLQEKANGLNGETHLSSSPAWPDMPEYLVHGGISSVKECVWQGCFIKPCGNLCSLSAVANT